MNQFTQEEIVAFKGEFRSFDVDGDGSISVDEMCMVLKRMNEPHDQQTAMNLMADADSNGDGVVDFTEFLAVISNLREGASTTGFGQLYQLQHDMVQVRTHTGLHSYAQEEMSAFAEHISHVLQADEELDYLFPINSEDDELARKINDGVLLAKFINVCVPSTIDERALNKRTAGKPLSVFQINENLNVVISAAKSIGVQVINIGCNELLHGEKSPHIVLGLLWQLVKMNLLTAISLKHNPLLLNLLNDDEDIETLMKMSADQLLLRWLNHHLHNAGRGDLVVTNFGSDLHDSVVYAVLLNQLSRGQKDLSVLEQPSKVARAATIIANADDMGVKAFLKPRDISSGNSKLNLAFCAAIFNEIHGLEELDEEELVQLIGLMEDDTEGSREERAFRMWINSMAIDGVYINSLYDDLGHGLVLLKLIDAVEPGIVDWHTRVESKPNNRFKQLLNANYAVDLGKQMKFSLVGIGGVDILAGNRKLILALVWQLMRYHTIKFLSALCVGGNTVSEPEIVMWANSRVSAAGFTTKMASFKDQTLSSSRFFIDLLASIERRSINWEIVTPGVEDQDKLLNARYAISLARKFNCTIFLLPEDIVQVKPKMMLTFVAAIMTRALEGVTLE